MVSKICVKQIVGAPQSTIMAAIIIFFFFWERKILSLKKKQNTHIKRKTVEKSSQNKVKIPIPKMLLNVLCYVNSIFEGKMKQSCRTWVKSARCWDGRYKHLLEERMIRELKIDI